MFGSLIKQIRTIVNMCGAITLLSQEAWPFRELVYLQHHCMHLSLDNKIILLIFTFEKFVLVFPSTYF